MECDQMRFIFQHSSPSGTHISSNGAAVLGSPQVKKKKKEKKKLLTADNISSKEIFSTFS